MEWLLANGGPVIRGRTARELLVESEAVSIDPLEGELIHSQLVRIWFN